MTLLKNGGEDVIICMLLPWLIHGLYDFSLTPELFERNDNLVFIPMVMALTELVAPVLTIRFFIRVKKHKKACDDEPLS